MQAGCRGRRTEAGRQDGCKTQRRRESWGKERGTWTLGKKEQLDRWRDWTTVRWSELEDSKSRTSV